MFVLRLLIGPVCSACCVLSVARVGHRVMPKQRGYGTVRYGSVRYGAVGGPRVLSVLRVFVVHLVRASFSVPCLMVSAPVRVEQRAVLIDPRVASCSDHACWVFVSCWGILVIVVVVGLQSIITFRCIPIYYIPISCCSTYAARACRNLCCLFLPDI
jgi:hypothetical protein